MYVTIITLKYDKLHTYQHHHKKMSKIFKKCKFHDDIIRKEKFILHIIQNIDNTIKYISGKKIYSKRKFNFLYKV